MWYFRHTLFANLHNAIFRLVFPMLGGIALLAVFVISVGESMNPDNGGGASIFGVGPVFSIGFGLFILGGVVMLVLRALRPEFFRSETLPRSVPERHPTSTTTETPTSVR